MRMTQKISKLSCKNTKKRKKNSISAENRIPEDRTTVSPIRVVYKIRRSNSGPAQLKSSALCNNPTTLFL